MGMDAPQIDARQLEPGDVLACFGRDRISQAISWGTASPLAPPRLRLSPSHVAIICEDPRRGLVWIESTSLCAHPCRYFGVHRAGVQLHHPEDRVDDYRRGGGRVDVYRLSPIDKLEPEESRFLSSMLIDYFVAECITYDLGGALISGTRLVRQFPLLRWFRDLHEVFCSELVAAALMRIGRLNRDDPTKFNPGRLCRRLIREGTYQFAGEAIRTLPLRRAA